jgi:hypothetical protein
MSIVTPPGKSNLGPIRVSSQQQYVNNDVVSPVNDLSMHALVAEGYSLIIDYYSGITTDDSELIEYSIDISSTLQTYARIKNLEIKTQAELNFDFIKSSGQSTLTGEAIISAGTILPKKYDLFIAEINPNERAVFVVNDVTPASKYLIGAYQISFISTYALDTASATDLERKTVKEYIYDKNRLFQDNSALVEESDLIRKNKLIDISRLAFNEYLSKFYDKGRNIFAFKYGLEIATDPYLIDFLVSIVNVSQIDELDNMNYYDIKDYVGYSGTTIWDKLLNPSAYISNYKLGLTDFSAISPRKLFGNIYYSGVNYFVSPDSVVDLSVLGSGAGYTDLETNTEVYPNLDLNEGYVISESVLKGVIQPTSVFESNVIKVLNGQQILLDTVTELHIAYFNLSDIEKFYYLPILMKMVLVLKV